MSSPEQVAAMVQRAVSDVLESAMGDLRARLEQRLVHEMQRMTAGAGRTAVDFVSLLAAIRAQQTGTGRQELFAAVADGGSRFAPRVAVLAIEGQAASVIEAVGFADLGAMRKLRLNAGAGLVGRAVRNQEVVKGSMAEMEEEFAAVAGTPASDRVNLLPVRHRERIVALLYADSGFDNAFRPDVAALEILSRVAGLCLEAFAAGDAEPVAVAAGKAASAAAAAAPAVAPAPAVAVAARPVAAASAPAPAAVAYQPAAAPPASVEEDGLHRKARRLAKVLVEEIRLYNQDKVAEGRQRRDLYDRLRDDIEKSRAAYDKKYANTPVAEADYFSQELIRILAEDDVALLGSNFRR